MVAHVAVARAAPRRQSVWLAPVRPLLIIGLVVLVGLLGLLYVSQSAVVASLGYERQQALRDRERAMIQNEQLRVEERQLLNTTRLEQEARRVGLTPPTTVQFVTAPRDALATDPEPNWRAARLQRGETITTVAPDAFFQVRLVASQILDQLRQLMGRQ